MKYLSSLFIILLGLTLTIPVLGQNVIIDEDFSDGDYTNNPTWTDNESKYIVNSSNLLQLDAPSNTDEAVITTPSTAAYGEWEALIKLDFNPSGSNLARFYIVSGAQNLQGDLNGYYIEIGDTDDEISLYRQDESSSTKIIDGTDDLVDSNPVSVRIKATRNLNGNWELFADTSGGTSFISQGIATDETYASSDFIGFLSDYTSTRSDLFEYDDIKVTKITPPLEIQSAAPTDNQTIDVIFNLDIDPSSVSTSDFTINNDVGAPDATSLPSSNVVRLSYNSLLPSNRYTVSVSNIDDTDGNTISQNTTASFILFGNFKQGDVAINEFVYDPPETQEEYVEIKNNSSKYLDLSNWEIGDDNGTDPLGSTTTVLEADSFLVISADTTALYNVYGTRAYYVFSQLTALNNGGDAIQLITDTGAIADSLFYSPEWGGEKVALERRAAGTPGIYKENWGNSPNPNGGTPGQPNEVAQDNTPPRLTDLQVLSNQSLGLIFDERLETGSASNPANYSINGLGISSGAFANPDSVELSLDSGLQNAQEYTLTVSGVEDIFGNAVSSADTTFMYYKISPADSGDVFVNEFNYDPLSGSTEYVEIYNPSAKSFDLQNWTLSDNRGNQAHITHSQFIIPPDSFAVIAPDNTLLSDYPDIALIPMGSAFPALNNSGDDIVIRGPNGALLDSLRYTSAWGGDQVALERRSVDATATIRQNWDDAPNNFGTPGTENEIEPDNTPPFFTDLFATDASTIHLVFSEAITPSSATNASNYEISPHRGIQLVLANQDSVTLSLDEPLTSGETYQVTASNLSDLLGNTLGGATKEFEFVKIANGQPSDIVINEILHTPESGQAEFVELYNSSEKNFDLNGWIIGDERNTTSIDQQVQLFPGEYLVITADNNFAGQIENAVILSGLPALNGDSDAVFIQNTDGITIDSLYYASSWGNDEDGRSLERKDPLAASNDASNWQTSTSDAGYSAGSQNAVFQPDSIPPKVVFSKILPENNIEVRFSEFIRLTNEVQFLADGQPLNIVSFDPENANSIVLEPPPGKTKRGSTIITVENLVDVKGNSTSSTDVALAQPLQQSDLVINEIMYNPLDEPDDNKPDQSEYLELRNTRDYAISLEGLVLHDAPDEDGNLRQLQPVSTTAKWVPAEGHVLVYASQTVTFEQSQIANFFDLQTPQNRSLMRVDHSSLSLASSDDAIFIADSTGATIDSVFYDESWQNPNIIDPTGVALERISPNGPSNNESNWGSSVHTKGGTPNSENSIYQENLQTQQETGISFSPNPFSPDDDGHEDNLFINYKLEQQDYLIRVRIYDRYGRLVRKLADGKQAGFEGQLIWDGRKNDGSRNRIGIYIVVFEAFNSTAGESRSFKETVVLARKLN